MHVKTTIEYLPVFSISILVNVTIPVGLSSSAVVGIGTAGQVVVVVVMVHGPVAVALVGSSTRVMVGSVGSSVRPSVSQFGVVMGSNVVMGSTVMGVGRLYILVVRGAEAVNVDWK